MTTQIKTKKIFKELAEELISELIDELLGEQETLEKINDRIMKSELIGRLKYERNRVRNTQ